MKVEQIYVAEDGHHCLSEQECIDYEKILHEVVEIMAPLPERPRREGEYVPCKHGVLLQVRRELWQMILDKYGNDWPSWHDLSFDEAHHSIAVGRVIDDAPRGPLERAWRFLNCCDFKRGRVCEQPFYVHHPNEAKLYEELEK